jgi:hypothetical protein
LIALGCLLREGRSVIQTRFQFYVFYVAAAALVAMAAYGAFKTIWL